MSMSKRTSSFPNGHGQIGDPPMPGGPGVCEERFVIPTVDCQSYIVGSSYVVKRLLGLSLAGIVSSTSQ